MLQRILQAISGILLGTTPMLIAAIFGVLAVDGLPMTYAILICVLLGAGGLYVGVGIFKMVYREGLIGFMSRLSATPELDNLEPVAGDGVQKFTAAEYPDHLANNTTLCAGGAMQIFGDWFDKAYQGFHAIESAQYKPEHALLIIRFADRQTLKVYKPHILLDAKSFLKILEAEKVEFEWYATDKKTGLENRCLFHYEVVGKKVVASASQHAHKSRFYTSLGAPAVIIYGKFA